MVCTGGALIQLVAHGLADAVLTGLATVTFWRHQHKAYTNFALEVDRNQFNSGVAQFGSSPKYNFDRIGDLIYFVFIEAGIPGLGLPYPNPLTSQAPAESILSNDDAPNGNLVEPYWTKDVGHALIEKAIINIGGQCIDEIYSEFLYIWEEISGQPGKHMIEMTGNYDSVLALQIASRQPRILYIPLPFWFTQNSGNALPIVSLQFHSVQLQVSFRPLMSLLKLTWYAMNAVGFEYTLNQIMARPVPNAPSSVYVQPVGDLQPLTNNSLAAAILTTYVYLDQRERSQFADGQFETLVTQHQHQPASASQNVSATNYYSQKDVTVSVDLNFNHPVLEMYFVARLGIHEKFQSKEIPEFNEWFNFCGPIDTITHCPIDPLTYVQLKLNNANRFPDVQEARYYRLVEPWQWHTNIVQNNCLYTYSFSLQPEDVQPAGSCNFSRIDNATMYLTVDRRCFTGPSLANGQAPPADGSNPSPNNTVSLLLFVQNYNILRFKYGLGGLRFAA
jgi:hypothetical protein